MTTTDDFDPDEDDGADIFLCTDEQEDYECLPISSRSNRVYLTSLGHWVEKAYFRSWKY